MVSDFLSPIFTSNHVNNISENIFDYGLIESFDPIKYGEFLNEYKQIASQFSNCPLQDSYPALVSNSLVLLRLIELNIFLEIDVQTLRCLLKELSGMIRLFDTMYQNDMIDGNMGIVISFQETRKVCELLQSNSAACKHTFTVDAVSEMPVTDITLALWNDCTMRHNGFPVKKEIRNALKAMSVYDNLLGSGVQDLLLNHTEEKAAKRIKIFKVVGLDSLFNRILAFYLCKTGNEKKRFLADIERTVADEPVMDTVNTYLSDHCSGN